METRLGRVWVFCYVPLSLHHPSKPLTSLKKSGRIGKEFPASLGEIREKGINPETEMRGWDAGTDRLLRSTSTVNTLQICGLGCFFVCLVACLLGCGWVFFLFPWRNLVMESQTKPTQVKCWQFRLWSDPISCTSEASNDCQSQKIDQY